MWSWGAGSHGQLGVGSFEDAMTPVKVPYPVVDMACGGGHVAAITLEGRVATWGRGNIGHSEEENDETTSVAVPRIVSSLQDHKIRQVAAGWNHTAFVSESGELFMCGDGSFGQLGLGDFFPRTLPCKVLNSVRLVACGMRHTLVVLTGDNVMAFGHAKHGQLGISSSLKNIGSPQEVPALKNCNISFLAANGDHSGALDENGRLYLWGRSFNNGPDVLKPSHVAGAPEFRQVSLGWNHGLGLTGNGAVFSWGSNKYGQLGRPSTSMSRLERIEVLGDKRAVWVSAGAEHSAAVLDCGDVMTWGWGEHGQLGLGSTADENYPQKVLVEDNVQRAYCGCGFLFALHSENNTLQQ